MALHIRFIDHEDRSRLYDAATKAHVALAADAARFVAEHGASIAAAVGDGAAAPALAALSAGRPGWKLDAVAELEDLAQRLEWRERREPDHLDAKLTDVAATLRGLIRSAAVLAVLDQIFILGVYAPQPAVGAALALAVVET